MEGLPRPVMLRRELARRDRVPPIGHRARSSRHCIPGSRRLLQPLNRFPTAGIDDNRPELTICLGYAAACWQERRNIKAAVRSALVEGIATP